MTSVFRVGLAVALLCGASMAGHYSMGSAGRFTPEPVVDAHLVGFANGYAVDTRVGEPEIPPEWRIDDSYADELYYIVQFTGPLNRSWFREIEREGVRAFGYLPHYAVLARMTREQHAAVAGMPMVRWTGLYQPAYKVEGVLADARGEVEMVALLFAGTDAAAVEQEVVRLGGTVGQVFVTGFGTTVTFTLDAAQLPAVARIPDVFWVQEKSEPTTANDDCQWVLQTGWRASAPPPGDTLARNVWRHGVRGQGVIMSTTDTGLNTGHDMFRDPGMAITPPGIWPDHRKVVAYKKYATADASEGQYHGSHVNGTVAGNDSITGGSSDYDGMSRDGRLYFVDLTNGTSFILSEDLWTLWDTTYAGRGLPDSLRPIVQHSGSWRWHNSTGDYKIQDASTDAFGWEFKDFLNIMAAGNERSARRIGNPSLAKNVLTIGATQNGTSANQIASFSSRGPTQDNRIKPSVCAPGVDLWSAQRTGQSGYSQMSGTSMATPAANGAVGLMRCYLQEGYYPTGMPVPTHELDYISAALLRSMTIVSADPNIGSYVPPSFDMGWGRLDADSVLHFPGQDRKLLLVDDTLGLATGEFKEIVFRVNSSIPLRVCLVWTDTAAAPAANPTLVNDLNLELVAPGGTEYRGNQYTSGQSTENPGTWDAINVEECCRVNAPDTGEWRIWVGAQNVATAEKQPFAWAITGDIEIVALSHDVGVTRLVAPVGQVDSGDVVTPAAVVFNYGSQPDSFDVEFAVVGQYADTQALFLAPGASDTVWFLDWVASPIGYHEARCMTMLAGDENPGNDVMSDTFQVIPASGIEGGADLPRAFALERARPTPFAGRTVIRFALPRGSDVDVAVYAVDGTLVRTLARGGLRAGYYDVAWDGRAGAGQRVSRGIYYCRMVAPQFTAVQKLVKVD